jgi:hypothetical protein
MSRPISQEDIEPHGIHHELRLHLERIAQDLGAESFEVLILVEKSTPVYHIQYKGIKASLWEKDSGMLVLMRHYDRRKAVFYQDEACFEIWTEFKSF